MNNPGSSISRLHPAGVYKVLLRYKSVWSIDLKLMPMLLGGVMKSSGNKPPAVVPNKGIYMAQDLKRLQQYFQVPLILPNTLMDLIMRGGSLNAMRFLTAVDIVKPEYLERTSRALWLRLYRDHMDIGEVSSFADVCKSVKMDSESTDKTLEIMKEQETKQHLRNNTDKAMDYGAFGAPMIVAHINNEPQVFFGSDRFELIAHVLGENWMGPIPQGFASKL